MEELLHKIVHKYSPAILQETTYNVAYRSFDDFIYLVKLMDKVIQNRFTGELS